MDAAEPTAGVTGGTGTRSAASSAACHQGNGMGDGQRFPPLGPRSWVPGNKQRLISVVLFGLTGEIQVDG